MNPNKAHHAFTHSDYGRKLANNIRFGDFKPDYIPNKLWEDLLGDDVNNLRHMPHTYEIARKFSKHEKIGGMLLRLTAITHDWGEAVVGDIALPDKENMSTADENRAYLDIAWDILGKESHDLLEVPEVLWGEHKLSEPFKAIEYIGYCQTGLRAGRMACLLAGNIIRPNLPRKQVDGLIGGLLALNKMVEVKNFSKLSGYTDKYPSIPKII